MLTCIRHAESIGNAENHLSGQIDYPLSDIGSYQARDLGNELRGQFDLILSSPLLRATQTARAIGDNIVIIPEMIERSGGYYEGKTYTELKKLLPPRKYKLWQRDWYAAPLKGESFENVHARVIPAYQNRIRPLLKSGKRICLVSHSVVMKVLFGYLKNMSEEDIMKLDIQNALPYVFRGPFH